jgi:lipopolysaccharide export system permease protein
MSILDRYLLRQYCQVLLICFCSLVGLFAVIDALGHLDQFTAHAQTTGSNVVAAIGRFYAFQAFGFFDRTSGILAMMAVMFTMAWFKRNNELTAVMAAGISLRRTVWPLLAAAASISIVAAGSREVVLPTIRSELLRTTNDLAGKVERPLRSWYDPQADVVLRGTATVAEGKRIVRPTLRLPAGNAKGAIEVSAAEARYLDATREHPAGYLFVGVDPGAPFLDEPSILSDGRVVLYSRPDTPWLEEGQVYWPSDVDFDQLAAGPNWRHFASTAELVDYVKRPARDVPTSAFVTLHGRLVRPILDFSLALIGLPLVLSRRGRSPFLAVGLAMGLVAAFLCVALTCEFLGNRGWIGPSLAAWLPLFVFVPLAVATSGELRR